MKRVVVDRKLYSATRQRFSEKQVELNREVGRTAPLPIGQAGFATRDTLVMGVALGAGALAGLGLSRAAGKQYKALTAKVGIPKDVAAHPALPSVGGALLSLGIYGLIKVSRRNGMSYSGSNLDRAVGRAKNEIKNAIAREFYHGDIGLEQIIERIAISVDEYNDHLHKDYPEVTLEAIAKDMTEKIVSTARKIAEVKRFDREKMAAIFRELVVRVTIELLKRDVIDQTEINDFYNIICVETGLEKGQITGTKRVKVGDYHILKRIGGGGMKTVYLAFHPAENKPVTIHFPKIDPADNDDFIRFVREASLIERAYFSADRHRKDCVMKFYDKSWKYVGDENINALRELHKRGEFYYVAEFIDGIDLGQLIHLMRKENKFNLLWTLVIFLDLIKAFKFLRQEKFIHRDLKTGNVMLTKNAGIKVIDFGFGKEKGVDESVTEETTMFGSYSYMPPEAGEPIGETRKMKGSVNVLYAGDIYSSGILLYVMLTGKVPRRIASLVEFYHYSRNSEEALPELDSLSFAGLSLKSHKILVALLRDITQKKVEERLIDHDQIIKKVEAILANDFGKRG